MSNNWNYLLKLYITHYSWIIPRLVIITRLAMLKSAGLVSVDHTGPFYLNFECPSLFPGRIVFHFKERMVCGIKLKPYLPQYVGGTVI